MCKINKYILKNPGIPWFLHIFLIIVIKLQLFLLIGQLWMDQKEGIYNGCGDKTIFMTFMRLWGLDFHWFLKSSQLTRKKYIIIFRKSRTLLKSLIPLIKSTKSALPEKIQPIATWISNQTSHNSFINPLNNYKWQNFT